MSGKLYKWVSYEKPHYVLVRHIADTTIEVVATDAWYNKYSFKIGDQYHLVDITDPKNFEPLVDPNDILKEML